MEAMRCPRCHAATLDGARFCEACGARLELVCGACGTPASAGARFCRDCGGALHTSSAAPGARPRPYTPKHLADKILTSRAALAGERKQVTVLFADVTGSMALQEDVDPERWHGIMDRFFAILTDGVHRFEGTVNQYTGDGIMALFGAPMAHEAGATAGVNRRGPWTVIQTPSSCRRVTGHCSGRNPPRRAAPAGRSSHRRSATA
jgi:class 3 adenylate cyclase